jgi:hypothetical protein
MPPKKIDQAKRRQNMVALKKEIETEYARLSMITTELLFKYDVLMLAQKKILGGTISEEEVKELKEKDDKGALDFLTSDRTASRAEVSRFKEIIYETHPVIVIIERAYAASHAKLEALFDKYPEPEYFNGARSEREKDVREQNEKVSRLRQKVQNFKIEMPDAPMVLYPPGGAPGGAPACAGGAGCAVPAPAAAPSPGSKSNAPDLGGRRRRRRTRRHTRRIQKRRGTKTLRR